MRWILVFLFAVPLAAAPPALSRRVEAIIASSPAAQRAFWGVKVVDAASGRPLVELNARRFFLPASNAKLFTTALALARLGANYRFETVVASDAAPDASGRLSGGLRLIGSGDPSLSGRDFPYHRGSVTGDPLQAIEALADQVVAAGVRRIEGDVVGDDTAYVWEPYPEGWAQDDTVWDYGAPVSALAVNDNVFRMRLEPAGNSAAVTLSPPLEFYSIDNRLRPAPGRGNTLHVERLPGSRQLRLWGALGTSTQMLLAIDEPALYAARAFAGALTRRGIAIGGRAVARHRYANQAGEPAEPRPAFVLARRPSPPLVELLRVIDKVSQNLHAEMVLREVGRVRTGAGTREAGLEEERKFLSECGITNDEFRFADASGLSGSDLVAPDAVVKLLRAMHRPPYRDDFFSLLPVGGQDGTLENRFDGRAAAVRIHAKTGSLTSVAALSGYIESRTRGVLAFSILVNNFNAPGSEIRALIDRIALVLAE